MGTYVTKCAVALCGAVLSIQEGMGEEQEEDGADSRFVALIESMEDAAQRADAVIAAARRLLREASCPPLAVREV